jgi:hypothetical protein
LGVITPAQKIYDLVRSRFVAMGIIVSRIGFGPPTISIKDDTNMLRGL